MQRDELNVGKHIDICGKLMRVSETIRLGQDRVIERESRQENESKEGGRGSRSIFWPYKWPLLSH